MTTTVEVKVTDGGSIDATTTKLVKLRDVKKEIESGTGKGGAAAIKSVADAAESGTAKFQKATGALQNLAAATGNPLLMKGASMFNGLAAGLSKVESGALGAASGMRVLMVAGGVVLAAITAAVGAFQLFNMVMEKGTTYGALLSGSIDDVASSTRDLTKASLEYEALHTPESMIKLADAVDASASKVKILEFQMQEASKTTFTWAGAFEVVAKMANRAWQNVKAFFGDKSGLAALNLSDAKAEQDRLKQVMGGATSDQFRKAGQAAIDAKKPKTGGKTAEELAIDYANKGLDAQLKLNDANSRLVDIKQKSSTIFSSELAKESERLEIESAQLKYAKEILASKGNEVAISAAQKVLEADTLTAQLKFKQAVSEEDKKQKEILRDKIALEIENQTRQVAANAELKQIDLDSQQNRLNFLTSQGILEADMLIARQADIELQREATYLSEGLAQAQLAVQAMRNEGKLTEEQITAEYSRQVNLAYALNNSKTEGVKLAAQASTELARQNTLMQDMVSLTETMAIAFGQVGKAIGVSLSAAVKMQENDKKYAKSKAELMKDEKKNTEAIAKLEARHTVDQINGISEIAGSTKEMFAEKTAAHKAFAALEKVTAAMSMALQAQQLAQTLATLPKTIAGGVSKLFEQGGWAGFAGAAAFLAMMASLGVSSGGSASAPKMSASSVNGSNGGVLGGSDKASTSLVDGIDKLNENNYELLRHSRGKMYSALVAIRDNIGNFMAGVSRSGLMASQTETGSSKKLFGLFGGSTSITAAGLDIRGTMGGGITTAEQYETVKSKKKFLGITTSSKSRTNVQELSDSLKNDIEGIFKSMGEALVSGAEVFGSTTEAVRNAVNSVAFDLSISTKGMSTDEIMKALEAKVGTELDRAIGSVLPGFANVAKLYQEVGESSLDFLVRASYTAENVMAGLESISKTVVLGRQTTAEFAFQLSEMMGGIDKFNEQTSFYAENFLSDAERLAPVQARVSKEMRELGLASVNTREEFKNIVQSLDLATVKGKQTYAALMELAPAFAAVYEESEKILTVEEKLADLKEKELTLKEKITQAYESESSAIKATIDSIKGSINSLVGYKSSLNTGANSTLTPAEKYALARSEAAKVAAAAASGDSAAASKLPSVLDNLLSTSKVMNASGGGYQADFDYVQRLLDMSIGGLEGQKTDAQKQLTTLENTYSTLNIMKEQSYTMVQLMQQLADLQTEEARIVTEQETNKRAEAELKALNEKAEALRRQQEAESREQILTLKQGFMGMVKALSPSTSNTTSSKQPIVNNPGYYIWNEPTGGA